MLVLDTWDWGQGNFLASFKACCPVQSGWSFLSLDMVSLMKSWYASLSRLPWQVAGNKKNIEQVARHRVQIITFHQTTINYIKSISDDGCRSTGWPLPKKWCSLVSTFFIESDFKLKRYEKHDFYHSNLDNNCNKQTATHSASILMPLTLHALIIACTLDDDEWCHLVLLNDGSSVSK